MKKLVKKISVIPSMEVFASCSCSTACGCSCGSCSCYCEGESTEFVNSRGHDSGSSFSLTSRDSSHATSNIQYWA